MTTTSPQVGVGVFVLDDAGRFILGERKGSHGAGSWALPGGHLELWESFEDCAEREVLEETGLVVGDFRFLTLTNDVMKEQGKHYVTIFLACKIIGKKLQPEILEPEKCVKWEWVTWDDVQTWDTKRLGKQRRLFKPLSNLLLQRPAFHLYH